MAFFGGRQPLKYCTKLLEWFLFDIESQMGDAYSLKDIEDIS